MVPLGFPCVASHPSLSSLSSRTSPPAASYSSSTDAALRRQGTKNKDLHQQTTIKQTLQTYSNKLMCANWLTSHLSVLSKQCKPQFPSLPFFHRTIIITSLFSY